MWQNSFVFGTKKGLTESPDSEFRETKKVQNKCKRSSLTSALSVLDIADIVVVLEFFSPVRIFASHQFEEKRQHLPTEATALSRSVGWRGAVRLQLWPCGMLRAPFGRSVVFSLTGW